MPSKFAMEKARQAWSDPSTKDKTIDFAVAEVFARTIDEITSQSWLGNATTKELLHEIEARLELEGKLEYKTVGGKDVQKNEPQMQDLRNEQTVDGKELSADISGKGSKQGVEGN